jgi:hypothetical protein
MGGGFLFYLELLNDAMLIAVYMQWETITNKVSDFQTVGVSNPTLPIYLQQPPSNDLTEVPCQLVWRRYMSTIINRSTYRNTNWGPFWPGMLEPMSSEDASGMTKLHLT